MRIQAAVDDEHLAGDAGGARAGEERHHVADLLGAEPAFEGDFGLRHMLYEGGDAGTVGDVQTQGNRLTAVSDDGRSSTLLQRPAQPGSPASRPARSARFALPHRPHAP